MGLKEPNNMFWGACKDTAYKGLKTRGHTGEGSPLSNVDIGIGIKKGIQELGAGESVGSTPRR